MTVIALTSEGKKIAVTSVAGPSSYTTGGFQVSIPELSRVEQILFAFITGGYRIGGLSISGNAVTVVVHYYDYDATSDGVSIQVPAGTNLSAQTVTLAVIGY